MGIGLWVQYRRCPRNNATHPLIVNTVPLAPLYAGKFYLVGVVWGVWVGVSVLDCTWIR